MSKKRGCKMQDTPPLCPPFDKGGMKERLFAKWGHPASCIMNHAGFSLVELMITMVLLLLSMAAATTIFTNLLFPFKQQTKIAETNIEGIVGLEMLRRDIEHAGYGLSWNLSGITYSEASSATICGSANPTSYNDSTSNPPKAVVSGNNNCTNSSDYLVIKAVSIARNDTSQKWTTLKAGDVKKTWDVSAENLSSSDKVIVVSPGSTTSNSRSIVLYGSAWNTTYNSTSNFAPSDSTDTRIIYGVDPDTTPRMPFNRADYYISTSNVPTKCAAGTGVLTKGVINQSNGNISNPLPLLDCVADMQVVYRRDTNADGTIDNTTNDLTTLTAQQIREQVKEIRVYILAHEGQMDTSYSYPSSTVTVGEFGLGSTFNLSSTIGSTYVNYRWRVYTIVVKPDNLRGS